MNQLQPTEVIELLEPIRTNIEGLDSVSYRLRYTTMANIKPFSMRSLSLTEDVLKGAEFFQTLYSIVLSLHLPDVTFQWKVRWRNKLYDIIAVQMSTLGSTISTSLTIRELPHGESQI